MLGKKYCLNVESSGGFMIRSVTQLLGWCGLIPFVIAIVYSWSGASLLGFYPPFVFTAYSGGILAFMAGTLWGRVQCGSGGPRMTRALFLSNGIALYAIVGVLLANLSLFIALIWLAAGYWLVWRGECWANEDESGFYFQMRRWLTYLVIGFHLVEVLIIF